MEAEFHHSQKLESMGRLAGGMAHDMNNVLAAIMGTAQLVLMRHEDDPAQVRSMDTILLACNRGRHMVNGLTRFARKDLEEIASLDLNDIVRKEVELLEHTTLKKIRFTLDLDETIPYIQGEATSLANALMNLSVNAVDAMPEGGTLTLVTRPGLDGTVELMVRDTGKGMDPEVLDKAFDPFFTTKPPGKGTGLGLSLVYGIMQAHGGTASIQSRVGEGSTVTLRFPGSHPGPVGVQEADPPSGMVAGEPLQILLVDDDELIQASAPPLLEQLGHTVVIAVGGKEALDIIANGLQPDLVLLDCNMPGTTGVETLGRIRADGLIMPIILCSGYMDADTETLARAYPQVHFLRKPYRISELRKCLDCAIGNPHLAL